MKIGQGVNIDEMRFGTTWLTFVMLLLLLSHSMSISKRQLIVLKVKALSFSQGIYDHFAFYDKNLNFWAFTKCLDETFAVLNYVGSILFVSP